MLKKIISSVLLVLVLGMVSPGALAQQREVIVYKLGPSDTITSSPKALVQQREGIVYELGPEVYSTQPKANGYQWYASGYVYRAGTYDNRAACEYDSGTRIGTYAIYGSTGAPGEHLARYRVTVNGTSHYFEGAIKVFDEEGKQKSYLFDLGHIVNGQPRRDDPPSFVEFIGRSSQCFGGTVKLFLGVGEISEAKKLSTGPNLVEPITLPDGDATLTKDGVALRLTGLPVFGSSALKLIQIESVLRPGSEPDAIAWRFLIDAQTSPDGQPVRFFSYGSRMAAEVLQEGLRRALTPPQNQ